MKQRSMVTALWFAAAVVSVSPAWAGARRLPPVNQVDEAVVASENDAAENNPGLLKHRLEQRLFSIGALRQQLLGDLAGLPITPIKGPIEVMNQGVSASPEVGSGVRLTPPPSSPSSPEAAGDVMVISGTNGAATQSIVFSTGTPPVLATHYASRFPTSILAKQLPFNVEAAWMVVDDLLAWSPTWRFQVVLESRTRPFWPDMATVVAPQTTFNVGTYFPYSTTGQITELTNAQIPFPNPPAYPANGVLAVADRAHDDDFASGGPLGNSIYWFECGATECNPGQLNMTGGQLVSSVVGQTRFGWRLPNISIVNCNPNPAATTTCRRYYQDYIDFVLDPADPTALINGDIYVPDQDIRLKVNYNLSGATAQRAGVFFRASFGTTTNFASFYALYLDKQRGVLALDRADGAGVLTNIMTAPVNPFASTGELVAEVTGWNPITIVGKVNGTAVITRTLMGTDPLFHGDTSYGNIFGVIFPNGGGGEILDNFIMERNADLFLISQVPPDLVPPPPPPQAARRGTWFEGNLEGREFYNTQLSGDNGATWGRIGYGGTGLDCDRSVNMMTGLQVRDNGTANNLFQTNNTLSSLYLPCCTCQEQALDCDSVRLLDECPGQPPTVTTKPTYAVGQPIGIRPLFNNEHAPNGVGAAVFCFRVCEDANVPAGTPASSPWCTCVNTPADPNYNCDCFGFDQGAPTAPPVLDFIPGLNYNVVNPATNDLFNPDGHPDGPLYLSATLVDWTPPRPGSYHAFVSETFDLDDNGQTDVPLPDEFAVNNIVFRQFNVTGTCAPAPQNLDRGSLKMVKKGMIGGFCPGTSNTDSEATWGTYTTADPAVKYNVHFVDGKPALTTECTGGCNPWLAASRLGTAAVGRGRCIANPTLASGIAYYAAFQADECNQSASRPDCSRAGAACTGGADCCSGTCTANVCQ